jgi:hypothetical protein
MWFLTHVCAVFFLALSPAGAAAPFRLEEALNTPDWLHLSGEIRARYDVLDGQFRADRTSDDEVVLLRTLVLAEADAGPVTFGVELQDSRAYLDDDETPLSASFVDAVDILQLYARFKLPGLLGDGSTTDFILGRQTLDIGSERQVERVDFANVLRSFTGFHAISTRPRGDELHVFLTALLERPAQRDVLRSNAVRLNQERWNRRWWAVHYRRADMLPSLVSGLWGELFVYGLNEDDTAQDPTADRNYVTPGFRIFRAPRLGQWDVDIEGSLRFGKRRATRQADDTTDLKTRASQLLARAGYTFAAPWQPRLAFQWYWASGDDDPDDNRFDQYERLFGGRRGDLNNTSIHGPLTPANLSAMGIRINVKPNARTDARLHWSAAFLASDTDSFVIARLRDPSGQSGDFMGHTIDTRARYWIVPQSLRLEVGASAFLFGDFTRNVPGGPAGTRTLYGYVQVSFQL